MQSFGNLDVDYEVLSLNQLHFAAISLGFNLKGKLDIVNEKDFTEIGTTIIKVSGIFTSVTLFI